MSQTVRVTVPASTANLGPGFDSFAAALSPRLSLTVEQTNEFSVDTDLDLPRDSNNLVVRAFSELHPPERFKFTVRSEIPLSGGLGSSAAAIVAGVAAADALIDGPGAVEEVAARIEGHPDNVAAAVNGGFVICSSGRTSVIDVPADLTALVVVPHEAVRTTEARQALPAQVPLADAVHNLANASRLALGLERSDLDLVAASLGDSLHQSYRTSLFPNSMRLVERAAAIGALGATISGAGPSVLFWVRESARQEVADVLHGECHVWADLHDFDFAVDGLSVEVEI